MKKFDFSYIDKTYWVLYIALAIVAVIALFSAGSTLVYERHSILGPVASQMLFLCAGIVVAFFLQFVPSRYIRLGGYFFLGISLLCLWSMLIPGNPLVATINGASRWIKIGGFTFQPSELAKLSLIIVARKPSPASACPSRRTPSGTSGRRKRHTRGRRNNPLPP